MRTESLALAKLSLEGLSLGDAFGEQFAEESADIQGKIEQRIIPEPVWFMTDDSIMAIGICEILERFGTINQDELAATFARNYKINPWRGYGAMAHCILKEIDQGGNWKNLSGNAFAGQGSKGNGAAMRVAPLGAFFYKDLNQVVVQARLSAEITHSHPEGQAGAIAVAVAAAYICREKKQNRKITPKALFDVVLDYTPAGDTRNGINRARNIPYSSSRESVVSVLGNGSRITASDTVPFCIWSAAGNIYNYPEALWFTVAAGGDRDTNCAIVGGIVSLATGMDGIAGEWLSNREPLDQAHIAR